ncbi:MAG: DUF4160 domain-containing protein [Saprospirales bacterium]|nr:DUF4160 domain-containing protein [Saprospirales bacterium]
MPTILRTLGFRFFFYSNEGNEPPHVHVEKADASGKFWIDPVSKVYLRGFSQKDERKAAQIVEAQQEFFKRKWYEYFG